MSELEFRDLRGMAEFRAAEALQQDVWGEGDTPDPADLMMVIQAEGGLVGGAFLDGRLVGYVFGFPTREPNIQHSHRLAVLPDMRGRGLGAQLKWYQRDWCLQRGIRHVRWTFDPSRTVNARLNLHRLGARSHTYYVDYYGEMGGINRGAPSDRLLVDWYLDDPAVAQRAGGKVPALPVEPLLYIVGCEETALVLDDAKATLSRQALREALTRAFADGHEVFDFADGHYVLRKRRAPGA